MGTAFDFNQSPANDAANDPRALFTGDTVFFIRGRWRAAVLDGSATGSGICRAWS